MNPSPTLKALTIAACVALGCTIAQAAPVQFDAPIPAQSIPAGKVVLVPVAASLTGTGGGAIQYFVSSDNKKIMVRAKTGNPNLKLHVAYSGTGAAQAFSGDLQFQLIEDFTPRTSAIIGGLAQAGFYDGLKFFRIASLDGTGSSSSIIAQGGDPLNNGQGGPGFSFDNEFQPGLIFTGKGQLAMANAGYNLGNNPTYEATNGSQFFVTNGTQRFLDFNHTIFAQLVRGFDVLDQVVAVPVNPANSKPTADVVIENASVLPNATDAVLYLSAVTTGSATISVKIWDGKTFAPDGKTPLLTGTTFSAVCVDDLINDPPIIVPQPDVVTPMNSSISIQSQGIDLEADYLTFGSAAVSGTAAGKITGNNPVTFIPHTGYTGPYRFAVGVQQLGARGRGSTQNTFDFTTIQVGVGDRKLAVQGETIHATPGTPLVNQIVAHFTDEDLAAVPGHFTATINWGDGVLSSGASVSITSGSDTTVTKPPTVTFVVTGSHGYVHPGSFPVTVIVSDTNGATATGYGRALVSASPIVAQGVSIVTGGMVKVPIATFTGPVGLTAAQYHARIDWGDGTGEQGAIVANQPPATGFSVHAVHKYPEREPYTACVTITGIGSDLATVWSRVEPPAGKTAKHLPPFKQAHLIGAFLTSLTLDVTGTGATMQQFVNGSLVLINSGNIASQPGSIRYYLSDDTVLTTGSGGDTLLKTRNGGAYTALPIFSFLPKTGGRIDLHPAGPAVPPSTVPLRDSRLPLPIGVDGRGKRILVEMYSPDPLTDHQRVDRTFVSGTMTLSGTGH